MMQISRMRRQRSVGDSNGGRRFTAEDAATASASIQNLGWERKRPEPSDRADGPNDETVGRATTGELKGNGLWDAVV